MVEFTALFFGNPAEDIFEGAERLAGIYNKKAPLSTFVLECVGSRPFSVIQ